MLALVACMSLIANAAAVDFKTVPDWLKLPEGRPALGNQHGDVAVSAKGEVYVSVQDPQAGLQVYAPDGKFLRNVPDAPNDFHGFVIRKQPDGEFIFGSRLREQTIVKMTLDGKIVMTIPASAIPGRVQEQKRQERPARPCPDGARCRAERRPLRHRRLRERLHPPLRSHREVSDVVRRQEGAIQLQHATQADHRHALSAGPHHRLRPRKQSGRASVAERRLPRRCRPDLLLPAAVTISGDYAIIGELKGRVSILDKSGAVVARLGTNTGEGVGTNQLKPEQWKPGIVVSPHGVAVNDRGDLFVSEFNQFGRVHRFNRQ